MALCEGKKIVAFSFSINLTEKQEKNKTKLPISLSGIAETHNPLKTYENM